MSIFADDKGVLFWIGEKLIGMDGFSYVELEKKQLNFLNRRKVCENRKNIGVGSLKKIDKELDECASAKSFKQYPNERTLDFNLFDILKSGCTGYIRIQRDTYYPGREAEVTITESKVITKLDKVFKRTLVQIKRRKEPSDHMEHFHNSIDFDIEAHISGYQTPKLPLIVLGRIFEEDKNISRTPRTGLATYSYSVIENEMKQLEVSINAEKGTATESNGSRSHLQLTCTCPSIAELNNPDRNNELNKDYDEIRKKVFGN